VIVGNRLGSLLRQRHFLSKSLDFFVELFLVGKDNRELFILFLERLFQPLKLIQRLRRNRRRGKQAGIELQSAIWPIARRIESSEPVAEVKQLANRLLGIVIGDRPVRVDGTIAERDDDLRLGKDRFTGDLFESRFVNQRRDIVLIGKSQSRVVLEGEVYRQFQSPPSVEASGAWIRNRRCLRLFGSLVKLFPFGLEKLKVAQLHCISLGSFPSGASTTRVSNRTPSALRTRIARSRVTP